MIYFDTRDRYSYYSTHISHVATTVIVAWITVTRDIFLQRQRTTTFNFTTMPSIPLDVLREILEHVDKTDLATLCRVSKIFCSCSQDVLYREIKFEDEHVIQTLATSTDIARLVRSFHTCSDHPELVTALRNM